MTKSILRLIPLLALISLLSACNTLTIKGDGNVISKEVSITDYSRIQVQGSNIELTYAQTDTDPFVRIECDQNIIEAIQFVVEDNELIIRPKDKHTLLDPTRFKIMTNSKSLKDLKMTGEGEYHLSGPLKSDKLKLDLAGSGTISADSLLVDELNLNTAGNGTIKLCGTAGKTNINASGKCMVKGFNLQTDILECKITGYCEVEITANKEIRTQMAGSCNLRYKGNPSRIDEKSAGSCSISKVD